MFRLSRSDVAASVLLKTLHRASFHRALVPHLRFPRVVATADSSIASVLRIVGSQC